MRLRFLRSLTWGKVSLITFAMSILPLVIVTVLDLLTPSEPSDIFIYPTGILANALVGILAVGLLMTIVTGLIQSWYSRNFLLAVAVFALEFVTICVVLALFPTMIVRVYPFSVNLAKLQNTTSTYHLAWHRDNEESYWDERGKLKLYRCNILDANCKLLCEYPEGDETIPYQFYQRVLKENSQVIIISEVPGVVEPFTWITLSIDSDTLTFMYKNKRICTREDKLTNPHSPRKNTFSPS